jgi:hypothetical protein
MKIRAPRRTNEDEMRLKFPGNTSEKIKTACNIQEKSTR